MTRRFSKLLPLLGSISLLVLCASTQDPATATAAESLSKQQAIAFAQAVNLTIGDVPGFVSSSSEQKHETTAEKRIGHKLRACVGPASSHKTLVELGSGDFERETAAFDQNVDSEVGVAASSSMSPKELAEIRSSHTRGCLAHYLNLLLLAEKHPKGEHISPVKVTSRAPSAPGAAGSFGWHISAAITVGHGTLHVYIDILAFVYGPAEISLFTVSEPNPFSAATEQKLFSLLLERAKAQNLP